MCKKMCEDRGIKFYVLENQFNVDNGAMIAMQGMIEHKHGKTTQIKDSRVNPYERTDDIEVNWK